MKTLTTISPAGVPAAAAFAASCATPPAAPVATVPMLYWEDLHAGQVFELGQITPTREAIIDFARQFDPQPFHLDDAAAQASVFGALCASGWHTCAMAMRLMVDGFLSRAASLGSPGLENIQWKRPVLPGDTLSLTQHALQTRPMASRPDVGLLKSRWEMTNQHGQQVMQMEGWGMFRRRSPGAAA